MAFTLTSAAFTEGSVIPNIHTGDGKDHSPPLAWTDPPEGTRSLALICEDPDAPRRIFTHWVLFNMPPETRELPENAGAGNRLPDGAVSGMTDFRQARYGGPAPPPGSPHRYIFRLFALNDRLKLGADATRAQVLEAVEGHVLAEARLTGLYGR